MQVIHLCLGAIQQCIPVGRRATLWHGGLVRCAKFLHVLFRLSQFCFCWPFLYVKHENPVYIHIHSNTIICKTPELMDFSQLLPREREKGRKKSSGGPGGVDFTGTCNLDHSHFQFRHFGRASLRSNHAAGSHRYQAYHNVVHFQLQCRRLSPSLAYSLSLRSPWAQTGEENHVLHNYHCCCIALFLLCFTVA